MGLRWWGWRGEVMCGGTTMAVVWWWGGGCGGDDDGGGVDVAVAARGCGDRIDRLMRNTFGLGWKTRRKTFPTDATAVVAGGGGGAGYEEREEMRC
ncbi:hypothetical protein Tco_1267445, partial [Tanacetum coccineum]